MTPSQGQFRGTPGPSSTPNPIFTVRRKRCRRKQEMSTFVERVRWDQASAAAGMTGSTAGCSATVGGDSLVVACSASPGRSG